MDDAGANVADTPLDAWRDDYPAHRPLPEDGVFELGLCMAGAVSAGAYTAGVLDMLIEALDAFSAERARRAATGAAPLHQLRVPVLGGASAGGMCAAIAAVFLDARFPPVRPDTPREARAGNPLWRAWVEEVDIRPLLGAEDVVPGRPLPSLLDCTLLERIVDGLLDQRPGMETAARPWLADPLRAVLTLANLRGVPYALRFDGSGFRHWMSHHADHVRYAIALDGAAGAAAGDRRKVGEAPLDRAAPKGSPAREAFKAVALGTGAFPVALAARVLDRAAADYLYRAALTPSSPFDLDPFPAPPPAWVETLRPAWPDPAPHAYAALCVDGGAMNNEPLDLVRRVLAGWGGRNPQASEAARRAVVLVDPFVNPGQPGPAAATGLVGSIMPLFSALIANSRFKPEDLALAADPAIGSRFMIAPSRGEGWQAEGAIAAGHLGGFLGFFAQGYREHDWFLGRRNARNFLRWVFVLPEDNPLFAGGRWAEEDRARWGVERAGAEGKGRHLPVIPLCGEVAERDEPLPPWPAGRFEAASIRPDIEARVRVAVPALRDALVGPALSGRGVWPWLGRAALRSITPLLRPRVSDLAFERVRAAVAALDRGGHAGEP